MKTYAFFIKNIRVINGANQLYILYNDRDFNYKGSYFFAHASFVTIVTKLSFLKAKAQFLCRSMYTLEPLE